MNFVSFFFADGIDKNKVPQYWKKIKLRRRKIPKLPSEHITLSRNETFQKNNKIILNQFNLGDRQSAKNRTVDEKRCKIVCLENF